MKGLCEHCGKIIEVDTSKSADLCPLCNGAIDTKSAVKMYKSKVVLCPNCGQEEIVDKSSKATVCSHCGKPFLQKNAVKQDSAVATFVEKKIFQSKKGKIAFFAALLVCVILFIVCVSLYASTQSDNCTAFFKDREEYDKLVNWLITLDGTHADWFGYTNGDLLYYDDSGTEIISTSDSAVRCTYEYYTGSYSLSMLIKLYSKGSRVGVYEYNIDPSNAYGGWSLTSGWYCILCNYYSGNKIGEKHWSLDNGWYVNVNGSSNKTQAQIEASKKLIEQTEKTADLAIKTASGVSMSAVYSEIYKFVPQVRSVASTNLVFFIIFLILSVGLSAFYRVFYILYKQKCRKMSIVNNMQLEVDGSTVVEVDEDLRSTPQKDECPACFAHISPTDTECPNCGHKLK